MKILFVHSLSAFALQGGAEVSLRTLTRALQSAGHECVMLVTGGALGIRRTQIDGIRIIEAGLWNLYPMFDGRERPAPWRLAWHAMDRFNPFMQRIVARVLREERPDVVSVHNLAGWSAAVWDTLREYGAPSVQVLHDQYALCASSMMFRSDHNCVGRCTSCRLLRLGHRRRSRQLDAVIGVSRFILERHRAFGFFDNVPIRRVVHNARSAEEYDRPATVPGPTPDGILRLGFIGSINPSKGVEHLIAAFKTADLVDAELLIAGDLKTPYARDLAERTTDPRVRFLGRASPGSFFSSIDVLALPSQWRDTFPGVAFESLIFGRPVIAAAHGGAPEIIRHEHNGLLYEPGSDTELAKAMSRLATMPGFRETLAQQAYIDGAEYLEVDRWRDAYIDIYRETIARHRKPQAVVS